MSERHPLRWLAAAGEATAGCSTIRQETYFEYVMRGSDDDENAQLSTPRLTSLRHECEGEHPQHTTHTWNNSQAVVFSLEATRASAARLSVALITRVQRNDATSFSHGRAAALTPEPQQLTAQLAHS